MVVVFEQEIRLDFCKLSYIYSYIYMHLFVCIKRINRNVIGYRMVAEKLNQHHIQYI